MIARTTMSRIIFINRFFYPDHSATSQILSDLAFALARDGAEIHVLTSRQIYDQPEAMLDPEAIVDGVRIHRLSTTRYGRSGLLGRAFDYLSFYAAIARRLDRLANRGDIVVAKTDPPLTSIPAGILARRRAAHLVNWLQDVYPEIAIELGVPGIAGPLGRVLTRLRDHSLQVADVNVVLGSSMADRLRTRGIDADRIEVIPNWTDDHLVTPVPRDRNPVRKSWGLEDKFVVGYSGNLGRAHEFETVLTAAGALRDAPDVVFVCIGGGQQFEALARQVNERQLASAFRFLPYQHRDDLKYSLGLADVHWISMRPSLEGLIFPSKLYGIAAAGRPIIALTGGRGEIAELVRTHGCGCVVEPGDGAGLARAIRQLAGDAALCAAMGRQARAMLEAHFTRELAFERWRALVATVERGRR